MFVTAINIARDGYYGYGRQDATKPLLASVTVEGEHGEIKLKLPAEASARMVALIAEEIAAAGRATAELMTASVFDTLAIAPPGAA